MFFHRRQGIARSNLLKSLSGGNSESCARVFHDPLLGTSLAKRTSPQVGAVHFKSLRQIITFTTDFLVFLKEARFAQREWAVRRIDAALARAIPVGINTGQASGAHLPVGVMH